MSFSLKGAWLRARRSLCMASGTSWFTWQFFKTELFPASIVREPDPNQLAWLRGEYPVQAPIPEEIKYVEELASDEQVKLLEQVGSSFGYHAVDKLYAERH